MNLMYQEIALMFPWTENRFNTLTVKKESLITLFNTLKQKHSVKILTYIRRQL